MSNNQNKFGWAYHSNQEKIVRLIKKRDPTICYLQETNFSRFKDIDREMHVKITMRSHHTTVKMGSVKKTSNNEF